MARHPHPRRQYAPRSASTVTRIVTEVCPTRTVSRIETHDIAHKDRLVELHLAHRSGHVAVSGDRSRLDGGRQVDVRQDHAAEDGAVRVGVLRQQEELMAGIRADVTILHC